MSEIWLISDTHFGHANILKFTNNEGERIRPHWNSTKEMAEHIFDKWNETVKPGDKVYHLGDVAFGNMGLKDMLQMSKLPGKKRLVRGNHDHYDDKHYHDAGFVNIHGVRQINGVWLTHVPMHPQTLEGKALGNVHGHLHANLVGHPKWVNVSVEAINYTPVPLSLIRESLLELKKATNG